MADHFFDTSAAAKHYRAEVGTATVDTLLAQVGVINVISAPASSNCIPSSPGWFAPGRSPPPISIWPAGGSWPTSPQACGTAGGRRPTVPVSAPAGLCPIPGR
jgi:hypothetical protein